MIDPAIAGLKHILTSAKSSPSVKSFIYTSTRVFRSVFSLEGVKVKPSPPPQDQHLLRRYQPAQEGPHRDGLGYLHRESGSVEYLLPS